VVCVDRRTGEQQRQRAELGLGDGRRHNDHGEINAVWAQRVD
jgi:hypothetical protein